MIYFVRQGLTGNVKIGFTNDIGRRVKQLQANQPTRLLLMRLVEGDIKDEKMLHRRFENVAIGGEWFRFHRNMMGDIGYRDLEMPEIGYYRRYNWPDSAFTYLIRLHEEITTLLGGKIDFARRCGVAPWVIFDYNEIREAWWGAAVIALAERGRPDITYALFVEAKEKRISERKARDEKDAAKQKVSRERDWIKANPGVMPWWEVLDENRHLLKPSVDAPLHVVPASSEAAA